VHYDSHANSEAQPAYYHASLANEGFLTEYEYGVKVPAQQCVMPTIFKAINCAMRNYTLNTTMAKEIKRYVVSCPGGIFATGPFTNPSLITRILIPQNLLLSSLLPNCF